MTKIYSVWNQFMIRTIRKTGNINILLNLREFFILNFRLKLFFRIKKLLTREKGPRVEISVIHSTTVTTSSMEYDAEIIRTHL